MQELFPIASGLVAGLVLGAIRPSMRFWAGMLFAVALGFLATVVSGEFKISWGYLLIDIPLVGLSAAAGLSLSQRVRAAGSIRS